MEPPTMTVAKRRIAGRNVGAARWKERVRPWPNERLADSSDSASTEDSSRDPSEDGSYRSSKRSFLADGEVEPKRAELSYELPSAGTSPASRAPSPHQDEDEATAELVKSEPEEKDVAPCLSSDRTKAASLPGLGRDGPAVESVPSSRDITHTARRKFGCTSCGKELLSVRKVQEHPDLGVGICKACYNFLFSSPYTKDAVDCSEEQCRWCGQGGRIVMCDHCDKSFCEACIVRNFGPRGLALVVSDSSWRCFFCDPEPLRVHIDELNDFQYSQPNFPDAPFPRRRKGTLISRGAKGDARDIILGTEGEGATIAELLAQEMLRRHNTGMYKNPVRLKPTTPNTCLANRKRKVPARTSDPGLHFEVHLPAPGVVRKQELPAIETPAAPPAATLPRIWIRPHQWTRKRQEAAERRKRAAEAEEAQSLKNVTHLPNDGPKHKARSDVEAESQLPESHCIDNKDEDADQQPPREITANSQPGVY